MNPDVFERAWQLARRTPANYAFFFDSLTSAAWIPPLIERDAFKTPYPLQGVGNYVVAPPWPASRFLVRMAPSAPNEVLTALNSFGTTDNPRVLEDVANLGTLLPADRADPAVAYIETQSPSALPLSRLSRVLAELATHLASHHRSDLALRIARYALVRRKQDPRPLTMDASDYEEFLDHTVNSLSTTDNLGATHVLSDALESILDAHALANPTGTSDGSIVWRPSISEHTPQYELDVRNLIINHLRDNVERLTPADTQTIKAMAANFASRQWHIFRRLSLYIMSLHPEALTAELARHLTDPRLVDEDGFTTEYFKAARRGFHLLSRDDRTRMLDIIDAGPSIKESAEDDTSEDTKHITDWKRRRVAPIADQLSPTETARFGSILDGLDPALYEKPIFGLISTTWEEPSSPVSVDDLKAMTIVSIVQFVGSWTPRGGHSSGPSREGLAGTLKQLFKDDPGRIAEAPQRLATLPPLFLRDIVYGLHEALEGDATIPWASVLLFATSCLSAAAAASSPANNDGEAELGRSVRQAVGYLLAVGLQDRANGVEYKLRTQVWNILEGLSGDPDPEPGRESAYESMGAPTVAINSTRGWVLHAIIAYGVWVRRHVDHWKGLNDAPEMESLLERRLDPIEEPSPGVWSVYGKLLSWLFYLDPKWTQQRKSNIFPADRKCRKFRRAAWESYLLFNRVYNGLFELLEDQYRLAIAALASQNAGARPTDRDRQLAEHLMAAYWQGKTDLSAGGLLEAFLSAAPPAIRAAGVSFVGHALSANSRQLTSTESQRLKDLWESRLAMIETNRSQDPNHVELVEFGWWFASGKFDSGWAVDALERTVALARRIDAADQVLERLADVASINLSKAIRILQILVEGDSDGWGVYGWRNSARRILEEARGSTDATAREAVRNIAGIFVARGVDSFSTIASR